MLKFLILILILLILNLNLALLRAVVMVAAAIQQHLPQQHRQQTQPLQMNKVTTSLFHYYYVLLPNKTKPVKRSF